MTAPDPSNHERDFPEVFREYIREELRDVNTVGIGIIERLDRNIMRADVALKHDGGAVLDNVPIATPYATATTGDIPPLRPGDEGLLVFSDLPLDSGLLHSRGHANTDAHTQHRVDDAIFLPSMVWYDSDDVPVHDTERAERVISHPDGPTIRMHGDRTAIEHTVASHGPVTDHGLGLTLTNNAHFQPSTQPGLAPDPSHGRDERRLWPRKGSDAATLEHPVGTHLTLTEEGVGVVPGTTPQDERRRGLVEGALTDPERINVRRHRHEVQGRTAVTDENVPVDGDGSASVTIPHSLGSTPGYADVTARSEDAMANFYVESKTASDVTITYAAPPPTGTDNLVYDVLTHPPGDGAISLTTEPLTHREQVARLTDATAVGAVANSGTIGVQEAMTRAENVKAFLEFYTGETLDATDPESWPDPEHVPPTDEWHAFDDPSYDPATYETVDTSPLGLHIDPAPDER